MCIGFSRGIRPWLILTEVTKLAFLCKYACLFKFFYPEILLSIGEPQPPIHGLRQELATLRFDYKYEIEYECDFSKLVCVA